MRSLRARRALAALIRFPRMIGFSRDRTWSGRFRGWQAFTLIELMTVIAIILVLAALVLGLAGSAQTKGAQARATAEIQGLSSAANSYQIDNGTYPRVTTGSNGTSPTTAAPSDKLNPATSYDPVATTVPTYSATSQQLYQLLCGSFYLDTTGTPQYYNPASPPTGISKPTMYFQFKASQLKQSTSPPVTSGYVLPTTVTAISDPFGFSYGYSTIYQANQDVINSGGTGANPTPGYNPTFDLWSTGGYSSAGKSYPTNITSSNYYTLWIRNW